MLFSCMVMTLKETRAEIDKLILKLNQAKSDIVYAEVMIATEETPSGTYASPPEKARQDAKATLVDVQDKIVELVNKM